MARFSESDKTLIWDWWQQGGSMRGVARELNRAHASVRTMIESYGGVRPVPRCRNVRHLSSEEREEISRGMAAGESLWSIASRLGRVGFDGEPGGGPQRWPVRLSSSSS